MQTYSKPILGLSTIQSAKFEELFQDYGKELVQAGNNDHVARLHLRSVAHFGVWLEEKLNTIEKALPPDLRRGTFPVEDKPIAWLSGRKLSGVNPWEDPTNSELPAEDS